MNPRWRERLFPNRGLAVSLLVMLTATLLSAGYLFYTVLTQREFVYRATEGVQAAFLLRDLFTHLQSAESASRGYVLSTNDKYLEQFDGARQAIPQRLKELRAAPATEAYQQEVRELDELMNERMRLLQAGLDRRQTQELGEYASSVNFERSRDAMEETQRHLDDLSNKILFDTLPEQRRASAAMNRAMYISPLVVLITLALCILITRYFTKAIEQERAIEGSKNEFLSLASHQLRTPATNVKQYIHLVLDGYYGDITPEQRAALETATRNNDIEISIINDLLDVAKVDLDQIIIKPAPHKPDKFVRQVMKDFRAPMKQRHQKLMYEPAKHVPAVMLDPTYFKSVLENLCDNASKYSPQHSTVTITEAVRENRWYTVTVADKGVGIPRSDQARLFKKFSRIPNELSGAVEGSGLGLYWVKRVVELHHGKITVQSKPGEGSEFTLHLPLAGKEPAT